MYVTDECVICGDCIAYCPQSAIKFLEEGANIDRDSCVECGVCKDSDVCPTDAIQESSDDLAWAKKLFGRLVEPVPGTATKGRAGGFDVKKNDVLVRIPDDKAVIRLEFMRPFGGVTIRTAEDLRFKLAEEGFEAIPTKRHDLFMSSLAELPGNIMEQRMLSTSFEFVVEFQQIKQLLDITKEFGTNRGIWISTNLACTAQSLSRVKQLLAEAGFPVMPRAKLNLGLGRRTEQ